MHLQRLVWSARSDSLWPPTTPLAALGSSLAMDEENQRGLTAVMVAITLAWLVFCLALLWLVG